jgi:hypothetical protein
MLMRKLLVLFVPALLVVWPLACEARVNVFEPWYPGLDMTVGAPYSSQLEGRFIAGERFWEIPAEFTYVTSRNVEVGGRWGLRSSSGNMGIGDLMLGGKYLFVDETADVPAVAGEFAISLPTGKFSDGIGTGSVDCLMQWLAKKKFRAVEGTFGLGMRFFSENSDKYTFGDTFFYQLGVSKQVNNSNIKELSALYCEIKGTNHGKAKFDGSTIGDSDYQELYLAPGADIVVQKSLKLNTSLLIGLTSKSSDIGILINTRF